MSSPALNRSISESVDRLAGFSTDLLRELVRIPSITGSEQPAQSCLAQHLSRLGLEVDVWAPQRAEVEQHPAFSDDGCPLGARPVVVARWKGKSAEGRSLILNGHMDVVPTGEEAAWIEGPWSGRIDNGRLWGRGACDMKGGLVSAITAIAALRSLEWQSAGDVILESVIGEETGGVGTLATLLRGYKADAAILMEPTGLEISPLNAGALSFRIRVHGKAAHGALRQEGVSAIAKFYRLWSALGNLETERHQHFEHRLFDGRLFAAPISIGRVDAGNWPSTVPELLVAEGRYGVLPGENTLQARCQFEAAIRLECEADAWLSSHPAEVEWIEGQFEPGETSPDAAIVENLRSSHVAVCGKEPAIHGVPYGSDLRLFTNYGGMDAVLYGPGDIRVAHSLNEYVPLDEVRYAATVIAHTIVSWCGGA